MKHFKHLLVAALTMFAAFMIAIPAFAAPTTGSITITNARTGTEYTLYKIFDATVDGNGNIAYKTTIDIANDSYASQYFDQDANGYVTAKSNFTEAVLKTDAFKTWAESVGTQIGSPVTATGTTVVFDNLDFGYYFIETDDTDCAITVDSTNVDAQVVDKNGTVTSEKWIVEGDKKVKLNEAYLNEPVNFELDLATANFDGGYKIYEYTIKDEAMPGFSVTSAPIVKVGSQTLTEGTDYTIEYFKAGTSQGTTMDSADHFEITIPWTVDGTAATAHKYDNGAQIVVTFIAILDPAKADQVQYGAVSNDNTLSGTYKKDNPTEPEGDIPEDKTRTFDTQLTLLKVDENGDPMSGAEFTLTCSNNLEVTYVWGDEYVLDSNGTYYLLNDGTYTTEAPNGNTQHDSHYADPTGATKYALQSFKRTMGVAQPDTVAKAFTGADGKIIFKGLSVGHYKLEETVVPAGYSKAADIEWNITFDPTTQKFASDNAKIVLDSTNNVFDTEIENIPGTPLPSTGGMGTTILYTVGGAMILAGIVMFFTKRRLASMEA